MSVATVTDGPAIGSGVVDLVAEPLLDPLRDAPRFRAFLREVRLAESWPAG